MSKQVVNQLIDSSLSLLAAIRTIMEDTPHVLAIEAARAQMVAIKATVSPYAQLPESTRRNSAAAAVTGYADKNEDIKPPVKSMRKKTPDRVASGDSIKRQIIKAMRHSSGALTHKEIRELIFNRPSVYDLDGKLPAAGLGPMLRELYRAGVIVKIGERNWCKYELPQTE
jgi:hypothetical protein